MVDEHAIDDGKTQGVLAANAFHDSIDFMKKIADEAREAIKVGECAYIAVTLIERHIKKALLSTKRYIVTYWKHRGCMQKSHYTEHQHRCAEMYAKLSSCFADIPIMAACNEFEYAMKCNEFEYAKCNEHLNKVGLKLVKVENICPDADNGSETYSDEDENVVEDVDDHYSLTMEVVTAA